MKDSIEMEASSNKQQKGEPQSTSSSSNAVSEAMDIILLSQWMDVLTALGAQEMILTSTPDNFLL